MQLFKSLVSTSLIASSSLMMLACNSTVDLTQVKIRSMQIVIAQDVAQNGLVPSAYYPVSLNITVEKSGGELEVVDHEDIRPEQIQWTGANLTVRDGYLYVAKSNLNAWQSGYAIEAKVLNNPYPAVSMTFATHWSAFHDLSYYGPAASRSGGNGGTGPNLVINSARAYGLGANWRLLRIESSYPQGIDWVVVPEANVFALRSVGANGRDGDDGAAAVIAAHHDQQSNATTYTCTVSAQNGDDGGNGGNGGIIQYRYYSEEAQVGKSLHSVGGTGGRGGRGGTPSGPCTQPGYRGDRGSAGIAGATRAERPSRAEIEALFSDVDLNGLSIID